MKKYFSAMAACLALCLLLAGCAESQAGTGSSTQHAGQQTEKDSTASSGAETKDPGSEAAADTAETEDTADTEAAAKTAETAETAVAAETKDTEDTAETAETAVAAETKDTADTVETADTAVAAETKDAADADASQAPVVYFTSDISAEGLVRIYEALGWTPEGNVAVKISTGSPWTATVTDIRRSPIFMISVFWQAQTL